MDKQEQQDCQHEGFKENELWELKGGKHDGYELWELEYGRDKIGVGECGLKGPEFKEQEYLEPRNIKNQPQGLRFDLGSKTQGSEEGMTLEWGETPQDGGGPLTRSISCD